MQIRLLNGSANSLSATRCDGTFQNFAASGIYFDDALSGQTAYGNLLVNIYGYAFLLGGGRDLQVTDNVIINAGVPIHYDDRAIAGIEDGGWFTHANKLGEGMWATLDEVDVYSDTWQKAYPAISEFSNDFSDTKIPHLRQTPRTAPSRTTSL